jgi:pimeloyl-ACP methyl ester carboxylesterase
MRTLLQIVMVASLATPSLAHSQARDTTRSPRSGAAAISAARPFVAEVEGKGPPMLLIPGLASSGDVWRDVVAHYRGRYECHVLTLSGFAGTPAVVDSNYLVTMRDAIEAYIRERRLRAPVVVGHSLGGFLALSIASHAPSLLGAVVNIDGLPFLPAAQAPGATAASARSMAEQMRHAYMTTPREQMDAMLQAVVSAMVRDTSRNSTVLNWMRTSDGATVGLANYELYTTDLRDSLSTITAPVLNLHAWAGYRSYGATRERTESLTTQQYSRLARGTTRINDSAHHFIMYDELEWMLGEMDRFLATARSR